MEQYQQTFSTLAQYENVIVCGDTNIIEKDEYLFEIPEPWRDTWLELGENKQTQFTLDVDLNNRVDGPFKTRLDRLFYTGNSINPNSFELVKLTYGNEKKHVSDHFGVLCTFKT